MEATKLPVDGPIDFLKKADWQAVSAWALGFAAIVYLSFEHGGFDPLVHDELGIVVWWTVLATVLVGALPTDRLRPPAWCALGLFAIFVVWTALSLGWTESAEKTSGDLARITGYLGFLALGLFVCASGRGRQIVAGVATGIALIAVIALLSRLHPAWFPDQSTTFGSFGFLSAARERLAYPLDYWNALGALIAIGLPAVLYLATAARSLLARGLAAAALPAMALAIFFTLSRSGMAAGALALVVLIALSPDRLPKLVTLAGAGAGGAILIAVASGDNDLQHALLNSAAESQGNHLLLLTLFVCACVGLAQVGFSVLQARATRPAWTSPTRRQSLGLLAVAAVVAVAALAVFDAPGHASHAWSDFKHSEKGAVRGVGRLGSFSGESRYQYWSAAVDENATKPLTGTGSGTFQFWWARNGSIRSVVRDAHSLYLQTLGELGIVGLALLMAFLLLVLIAGIWLTLRAELEARAHLAAAAAGGVAFCAAAAFDWSWQMPVLPVAFMLLIAALLSAGAPAAADQRRGLAWPLRAAVAVLALLAVATISIPLTSTSLVRQSQADARDGELGPALKEAREAQDAQPDAASPRLQQALILEDQRELGPAALAARAATEKESTNWQTWLVLSRIEAERGRAVPALHAYRRAKSLNPRSALFEQ